MFKMNTLTNLRKGFYGAGTCEETALQCNEMFDCYPSGIHFDGADLPDQGYNCLPNYNVWNGNNYGLNDNLKISGYINGNQIKWYYAGASINSNPLYPEPSAINIVLPFLAINCGPIGSCGESERYLGNLQQRAEYLEKVIQDTIDYLVFPYENRTYDLEYAQNVMSDDSSLIINSVYEQFLQGIEQENLGKLNEVRRLLMSGEINLAYIKNNAVIYQNIMQQNAKAVNSIELNKLLNYNTDPYSLVETNTLNNVAYQPAMLGGKAVYNAREDLRLRLEDGASSLRQSTIVSKENNNLIDISVLPNPSNGTFNIKSNDLGQFDLTIMDVAGKIVFNDLNCSNRKEIDINYLQNGIYFLMLEYSDGNHKTSKLVINH